MKKYTAKNTNSGMFLYGAKNRLFSLFFIHVFFCVFLLISTFSFFCCFRAKTPAEAADIPYVKIGEEVWLLDIDTGRRLFLLPETYYAVIDNIEGDYYYVTFNGISGKVMKSIVSVTGYHATAPGTVQEIKIDPKYHVFTEIKLKSAMDGKAEEYEVPTTESLYFLGKFPTDDMWYYVRYNENCGYLRAEYTTNPDISVGVFTPEQPPTSEIVPDEPVPEKNSGNLTKILVITGACVAAVAVLIIIFLPKKKGRKYYYEDTE